MLPATMLSQGVFNIVRQLFATDTSMLLDKIEPMLIKFCFVA